MVVSRRLDMSIMPRFALKVWSSGTSPLSSCMLLRERGELLAKEFRVLARALVFVAGRAASTDFANADLSETRTMPLRRPCQ